MAIRFATMSDLPGLIEGASRMHALTRFKNHPFNAQKVANAFADLIRDPSGKYVFFVATSADESPIGALIGVVEQQIFSDAYTASIMHFDVLPEARMGGYAVRLLKAFEQWARNRCVVEVCFGINSDADIESVGRFAEKMGYSMVGQNFVKAHQ
ncbi:MAG TPA: GNAT family N-acetyltransferase [Roseateles sp.]